MEVLYGAVGLVIGLVQAAIHAVYQHPCLGEPSLTKDYVMAAGVIDE